MGPSVQGARELENLPAELVAAMSDAHQRTALPAWFNPKTAGGAAIRDEYPAWLVLAFAAYTNQRSVGAYIQEHEQRVQLREVDHPRRVRELRPLVQAERTRIEKLVEAVGGRWVKENRYLDERARVAWSGKVPADGFVSVWCLRDSQGEVLACPKMGRKLSDWLEATGQANGLTEFADLSPEQWESTYGSGSCLLGGHVDAIIEAACAQHPEPASPATHSSSGEGRRR